MHQVYLLLGVNLGDRFNQLKHALIAIEQEIGDVITRSAVYETAAWGAEGQPAYLNQVVIVNTDQHPEEVLRKINEIECLLGRTRTVKWESRVIDIDILFYDDTIVESERLSIPHPFLHQRKFTLVPLAEIAGDFIHPVFNKSVMVLLAELHDQLEVVKV